MLSSQLSRGPARLRLAQLPTPIDRAAWLDTSHATVWIKRDDLSSSTYGGGKVRKLEWILANPPFDGTAPVLSVGGVGSHHLLALALFLRAQDRELHGLTFTQPLTPHTRANLAVLVSTGAKLWNVSTRAQLPWAWLRYQSCHTWGAPSCRGTPMSAGASTPLGCLGFVEAAFELHAQIAAGIMPAPDVLYVTAGTAGTGAGLAAGLACMRMPVHLRLVSSVERWAFNRVMFARKLRAVWRALGDVGFDLPARTAATALKRAGVTWSIDAGEVGPGYGAPTAAGEAASARAEDHAVTLDPTYTAKCVAALRRHEANANAPRTVLFWHTHASNNLEAQIDPQWRTRLPAGLARAVAEAERKE